MSHASETGIMEKLKALSLAKGCYSMKFDLLTNATVVDDAMRFVQSNRIFTTSGGHHMKSLDRSTK